MIILLWVCGSCSSWLTWHTYLFPFIDLWSTAWWVLAKNRYLWFNPSRTYCRYSLFWTTSAIIFFIYSSLRLASSIIFLTDSSSSSAICILNKLSSSRKWRKEGKVGNWRLFEFGNSLFSKCMEKSSSSYASLSSIARPSSFFGTGFFVSTFNTVVRALPLLLMNYFYFSILFKYGLSLRVMDYPKSLFTVLFLDGLLAPWVINVLESSFCCTCALLKFTLLILWFL